MCYNVKGRVIFKTVPYSSISMLFKHRNTTKHYQQLFLGGGTQADSSLPTSIPLVFNFLCIFQYVWGVLELAIMMIIQMHLEAEDEGWRERCSAPSLVPLQWPQSTHSSWESQDLSSWRQWDYKHPCMNPDCTDLNGNWSFHSRCLALEEMHVVTCTSLSSWQL